ncbi:MAG TPA: hypothetical protein DCZ94_21625 [Lentisphaeria bacterium]|nr:MAG: hypothetical protein A2X48_14555 [Lentisphaerae bacterium GWF2_49_21]HBC89546.1 hypothetical protein [Lentisphaeria bacterium]
MIDSKDMKAAIFIADTQGLLFETEEDKQFHELEQKIISHSAEFSKLPEMVRKFVILYLKRSQGKGVKDIARQLKLSKSKAYEMLDDPNVANAMTIAAQCLGVIADVKASRALDITAENIYRLVRAGKLHPSEFTPTMYKICADAKTRLGMNPAILSALSLQVNKDGTTLTQTRIEGEKTIAQLLDRQKNTRSVDIEAESADFVYENEAESPMPQPQSPAEIPMDTTIQN